MAASDRVRLHLFYDSACPLCRQFIKWIRHLDREGLVEILPLDDPQMPGRFPQLDVERANETLTVCDRLGHLREGVEAVRQLTLHLPGLRRLQWVYRLPGVTPTLRGVYRGAQRHRKKLCLSCGEKWMPSLKYSRRKKSARGRRSR
jgi:predicted DCC family thiol-disulfide oxidoreductase YuxK